MNYGKCQNQGCKNKATCGLYRLNSPKGRKQFIYVCNRCEEIIGDEWEARAKRAKELAKELK